MTPATEHIIVAQETVFGTWVTPTVAFPSTKGNHTIGRNYIPKRYTGSSRTLRNNFQGSKSPSGSLEMDLWPENMGVFFKAAGLSNISSAQPDAANSPTVYRHAMLLEATNLLDSLSLQFQRSASAATNILSAIIEQIVIKASKEEVATIAMDFLCKDEAAAGGTWDYDGSASPAVIASPTYIASTLTPFRYFDAAITLGGTPSLTGNEYSIAGGVAQAKIEAIQITIKNNLDQAHFLTSDPTPGVIHAQNFEVSVQLDLDQSTLDSTFYDHARAGTRAAINLDFVGAIISDDETYELSITLPEVSFEEANWPELSGDQARRVQSASGMAIEHPATAHAIGVVIQDTLVSY